MFKVKMPHYMLINLLLLALGIIVILIGIIQGAVWRPLLESIGIGLLAAAAVNMIDRIFEVEKTESVPVPPQPTVGEKIVLAAYKRCLTPPEIHNLKFTASKVDIVGITLNHAVEELIKDEGKQIIENLLFHNLQLRLFMMHPCSPYLQQRIIEDNDNEIDFMNRQREAVKGCVRFYELLKKRYDAEKRKGKLDTRFVGSLQIKLLNFCPYMSIFRINDDRIYWGLYTSGATGLNLPLYLTTTERDPSLYAQLHDHIHGLMDRDTTYDDLVMMANVSAPKLDLAVLKSTGLTYP